MRSFDLYSFCTCRSICKLFTGDGLLPAKLARNKMCSNFCDVESNLLGIGSTNLVKPQKPVEPQFNKVQSLNIMEKTPLYVPAPFVAKSHQRPSPLN